MLEQAIKQSQLPKEERIAKGKALRKQVPRSSHAEWNPPPNRPDPLSLLQKQDKGRLEHLLPIKYGRMLVSPFAFYRGSAVVMASDLASTPVSGLEVILCGDAHLSNFGIFATPERKLVFDINDFDEVYPGPWEWDLKRLAASAVLAGRENGFNQKACKRLAKLVSKYYRESMSKFEQAAFLDVWYFHVEAESVLELFNKYAKKSAKHAKKTLDKAETRTSERTMEKLTEVVDGRRVFVNNPPLVERWHNLLTEEQKQQITKQDIENAWEGYISSLPMERRFLLDRFRFTDAALRVGGVGSVGTRCNIVLLEGDAEHDGLILQQKEAGPSALAAYLPQKNFASQAERIVIGQRAMQAASDIFLGWHKSELSGTQYYWRQLKDKKGSFEMQSLDLNGMATYLAVCAACLARAHARTSDASMISGYLGSGTAFDKAIASFAVAYADQTERDYARLVEAVKEGRIAAETGI